MTQEPQDRTRRPWWYSGDEEPVDDSSSEADDSGSGTGDRSRSMPGIDVLGMVGMVSGMVDWATERVMAPHAEHANPAEHPQCMVCRAMTWMGESPAPGTDAAAAPREAAPEIRWIPIREARFPA